MNLSSMLGVTFSRVDDRCPLSPHQIGQGRYMRHIKEVLPGKLKLSCGHTITCLVLVRQLQGWSYCPECIELGNE